MSKVAMIKRVKEICEIYNDLNNQTSSDYVYIPTEIKIELSALILQLSLNELGS